MTAPGRALVVGSDGIVGSRLCPWLRALGWLVTETTRRVGQSGHERMFLDLSDQGGFSIPDDVNCAFVLAAATNYEQCEIDSQAERINVVEVPRLVGRLLQTGIFTIFASSVVVFGGTEVRPDENAAPRPTSAYGRHKAEGENRILKHAAHNHLERNLAIVRITKSMDSWTRPVPQWIDRWRQNKIVRPFTDLYFSPITLDYICSGFAAVASRRSEGIHHLAGSENLNYADFCLRLSTRLSVPRRLVDPILSQEAGAHLYFRPKKGASLTMTITSARLGIEPQPVREVIDNLVSELYNDRRALHRG